MLDQLIKLVQQNAGDAIVKNPAVPNQYNDAAIQEVASQIFSGFQGQIAQGNMQQVVSMFKGGSNPGSLLNNPMVAGIISKIAGNFASKFGVSPQVAQNIVASLVPNVMNQLVNKTNDPDDSSFDLTDMMRNMSGNSSLDVSGMLGQLTGSSVKGGLGKLGGIFGK